MLEHLDYKILDYVSKFDKVTKKDVISHFSKSISDIEYRFNLLCKETYKEPFMYPGYIAIEYKEVTDSSGVTHFEPTGYFYLSNSGRKALNDYKEAQRRERRTLWLKNAWIPILVTIATNIALSVLKWLLQLILRLLSRTP